MQSHFVAAFLKMVFSACDGLMADEGLISDLKVSLILSTDFSTNADLIRVDEEEMAQI